MHPFVRRFASASLVAIAIAAMPASTIAGPLGDTQRALASARAATAPYHEVERALVAGYVDIGLFIPGMGHHYIHPGLLADGFDPAAPELLVYTDAPDGGLRLVAVEYAVVRVDDVPPAGFDGDADHWHADPAGVWTLHAWVWLHNPDGTFAAFNPRLP